MNPSYHRITKHSTPPDVMVAFGVSIVMHALVLLVSSLSGFHESDRLSDPAKVITVFLRDAIVEEVRGVRAASPAGETDKAPKKGDSAKKRLLLAKEVKSPAPKPVEPKVPAVKEEKITPPVSPDEKSAPAPAPKSEPAPPAPEPVPVPAPDPEPEPAPEPEPVPEAIPEPEPQPTLMESEPETPVQEEAPPVEAIPHPKPVEVPVEVPPVTGAEKGQDVLPPPMLAAVEKEPEQAKASLKPKEVAVPPADKPKETKPVQPAPDLREKEEVKKEPEAPMNQQPVKAEEKPPAPAAPVKTETPPPAPAPVAASPEPRKEPEAPTNRQPVKAEEKPPAPQKEQGDGEPAKTAGKTKEESPIQRQAQKPGPVAAAPAEVKKNEPEKGGVDGARESAPPVRSSPTGSATVAKSAAGEPKEKEAVKPARIADAKVAAPAKKRTLSTLLQKMLGLEKELARTGGPVDRPSVKITTPTARRTVANRVQHISGRVTGNGIARVILSINGESVTVPVINGQFFWEGALLNGKNSISASVWDRDGNSAKDQVMVEARFGRNAFPLTLDEPAAGEVDAPVVTVRGKVGDKTVGVVRITVNRESLEAAAEGGSFEKTVFLKEKESVIQAEAVNSSGLSARSDTLKVIVGKEKAPDILLRLLWEEADIELRPELTKRSRAGLDEKKGIYFPVDAGESMSANDGYREKVFTMHEVKEGAYSLSITGGKGTRCLVFVTLYPDVPAKRKTRLFGPVLAGEKGAIIGRLLMPEGVFWDEDEWFGGTIEEGDSIMKYNTSEGVSWKEEKK